MNKANYLADVLGYDVLIVTTEQKGRLAFFRFSQRIRFADLNINYEKDSDKPLWLRMLKKKKKAVVHRRRLEELLNAERPDICISMFDRDVGFLYKIKDGSKKILEYHFSKNVKLIEAGNFLIRWIQKMRISSWERMVQKYDRFVVLTEEDKLSWHQLSNVSVIPNFIHLTPESSSFSRKELLSIGRLSYQKGFDRLIKAFKIVHETYPEWKLIIYGDGEEKDKLLGLIEEYNLVSFVVIHRPVKNVEEIYCNSSCFVLTSRYEGLPMVLLEAMSYGLPIISYDCKCGPKDLINNGLNGFLVPEGNIEELANTIMKLISNRDTMIEMGRNAKVESQQYEREAVLKAAR